MKPLRTCYLDPENEEGEDPFYMGELGDILIDGLHWGIHLEAFILFNEMSEWFL